MDKLARQPYSLVCSVMLQVRRRSPRPPARCRVLTCDAALPLQLNLDYLLERMWEAMGLVRVYTKRRGEVRPARLCALMRPHAPCAVQPPDFSQPVVLSESRHGCTVEAACIQVRALPSAVLHTLTARPDSQRAADRLQLCARVGLQHQAQPHGAQAHARRASCPTHCTHLHAAQHSGMKHELGDEDVLQIVKRTVQQQRRDRRYAERCQEAYDSYKKKKKALKS